MQEICQSGSEGGAKHTFVPTPIDAESPRPGGTVEVIVSPIVSPRDICRRNAVHAALETLGIPVEKFGSDDVRPDFGCNEWFLAAGRRSH